MVTQLLRKWMLNLASASLAELSVGQLPGDVRYTKKMSRKQHNRNFRDKLMGVRIWRDSSCSLFKELKVHVQVYMNKLAGQCHKRVQLMASEPDGHLLARFRWTRASERLNNDEIICSETVYIAQLHRRALILDRAYKKKIVDSLEQTMHALADDPEAETHFPEACTRSSGIAIPTNLETHRIYGIPLSFDKSPNTLYNKSLDTSPDRVRDDRDDNVSAPGTR